MTTSFLVVLSHNRSVVMWKSTFGKVRKQLKWWEEAMEAYLCEIPLWKLKRCSSQTSVVTIQQQETSCCLICQEGATFIWKDFMPAVISAMIIIIFFFFASPFIYPVVHCALALSNVLFLDNNDSNKLNLFSTFLDMVLKCIHKLKYIKTTIAKFW